MRSIGDTLGNQARKLKAVASGALPNGDPVVVNSDGTVSAVEGTDVPSFGAVSDFTTNRPTMAREGAVFDSVSNKVIVAYTDIDDSSRGKAVVGTVSGTSISFGTPETFEVSTIADHDIGMAFDPTANKVVIGYRDGANDGAAIVGTVSGTSISFGSKTIYETGTTFDSTVVFDSTADKVVIAFSDANDVSRAKARVGTISGTSISFGGVVTFDTTAGDKMSAAFDSSAGKVVIAYSGGGSLDVGRAVVGTVSGTSISFGTYVQFAAKAKFSVITFDSGSNKVVVAYRDHTDSNHAKAIVGTVSGTSITFGTPVVFQSGSGINIGDELSIAFDSTNNLVAIAYTDRTNSLFGTLITGTVSGASITFGTPLVFNSNTTAVGPKITFDSTSSQIAIAYRNGADGDDGESRLAALASTNLTSENYIGVASSGYADAQGATIDIQGSINSNQSGLTPGQAYYVQTDGTLDTTPADPEVFAGTALTATKLLVKG